MAATSYQGDPTAVMGRRILAYVVDGIIALVLLGVILVPMANSLAQKQDFGSAAQAEIACERANNTARDGESFSVASGGSFCANVNETAYFFDSDAVSDLQGRYYLVAFGFGIANFILLQGLVGGSLGKLVTGIRVVRADGRVANIGWQALRWVILLVEGAFCFLIGLITASTTKGHRRVGDMAAGTFVVRRSQVGQPLVVPGVTAPAHQAYQPYQPYQGSGSGSWPAGPAAGSTWTPPGAPSSGGWTPPGDATAVTPGAAAGADGPTWDAARNAYIQWDPAQGAWVQWDDAANSWRPISQ